MDKKIKSMWSPSFLGWQYKLTAFERWDSTEWKYESDWEHKFDRESYSYGGKSVKTPGFSIVVTQYRTSLYRYRPDLYDTQVPKKLWKSKSHTAFTMWRTRITFDHTSFAEESTLDNVALKDQFASLEEKFLRIYYSMKIHLVDANKR